MRHCYWELSEDTDFYLVTCTENVWILGLHKKCPVCGKKVTNKPTKSENLIELLKTMTEEEKLELLEYYYKTLEIKPLNTTIKPNS